MDRAGCARSEALQPLMCRRRGYHLYNAISIWRQKSFTKIVHTIIIHTVYRDIAWSSVLGEGYVVQKGSQDVRPIFAGRMVRRHNGSSVVALIDKLVS